MLCDSFREWGECGEADELVGGGGLFGGSGDLFGLGYGLDEVHRGKYVSSLVQCFAIRGKLIFLFF